MNWRIFVRKGHRTLREIREGPFRTKRNAMEFADAEVSGDWYVAKVRPPLKRKSLATFMHENGIAINKK